MKKQEKFNQIADSHINGQFSQVREQFKKLNKIDRKECIKYIKNELQQPEISDYLFEIL
jgi:hypothetical protein